MLNDSRVIPARLFGVRAGTTRGKVEVLLTEQISDWEWRALMRPARRMTLGQQLAFAAPDGNELLHATVTATESSANDFFASRRWTISLPGWSFWGMSRCRPTFAATDQPLDRERYQTVFARQRGSVAAPTAGLHFTPEILERIRARGVLVTHLTLHVGLGTFQPVRVPEVVGDPPPRGKLFAARGNGPASQPGAQRGPARRGCRHHDRSHAGALCRIGRLEPHTGTTSIFLSPGSRFKVVGALLTNFHLPQSTLLMLVSAFAGREKTLAAYRHAVEAGYRFFSYGDCMFIT